MRVIFLGALALVFSILRAPSVQANIDPKPLFSTHHLLPLTHSAYARGLRAKPIESRRARQRIIDYYFGKG